MGLKMRLTNHPVALANTLLTVSSMDWALAEKLLRERVAKAPMCLLKITCLLVVKLILLRSDSTFIYNYK